MKIILELYDNRYTVETIEPNQNDFNGRELKGLFSRLLVLASFSPDLIDEECDGNGRWEYVKGDEIIVKQAVWDTKNQAQSLVYVDPSDAAVRSGKGEGGDGQINED